MKYKVFDAKTGEDITEERDWLLYPNGEIIYREYGVTFSYPKDKVKIEAYN